MSAETLTTSPIAREPRRLLVRRLAWMALANTLFFLALGITYLKVAGWPATWPARVYLVSTYLSHFATLAALATLPAWLLALAVPRSRVVTPVAVALFSIVGATIWLDTVVFRLYRFHLNGMVWSLIVNGGLTEILPLTVGTWLTAAGAALGVVLLQAALAHGCRRWCNVPRRGGRACLAAFALLAGIGQSLHAWADATNHTEVTRLARHFPGLYALTAETQMQRLGFHVQADPPSLGEFRDTALHYPLAPLACAPPSSPHNVLLIVVDAWRFDLMTETISPNIWRFAQESLRFTNHSAIANSTRFGIFSMVYGLYGDYWHAMLAEHRGPVLVDELLRAGYAFGVFGSARLTSPEFDRTVFAQVRDRIPLRTEGGNPAERDQEITRRFHTFLDQRDPAQPFFGFLFYDATHAYAYPPGSPEPFQPVAAEIQHLELDRNTDPVPVRNRFLNAMRFVDGEVGSVLARIERDGLLSNTVVIVTADHGQEFNETGLNAWGHNSNFSRYQVDVPLVVRWPGRSPCDIGYLTSHLDVAPTLLQEVLGCSTPPELYGHGKNLFDPASRMPLVASTWDGVAIISTGRIDVLNHRGPGYSVDSEYRPIESPVPAGLVVEAMRGLSRFYAR